VLYGDFCQAPLGAGAFAEELLLGVAHAYEQATPWHTRRAPGAEG